MPETADSNMTNRIWGVRQIEENLKFRVAGMVLTFTALIGSPPAVLSFYLPGLS